METAGDRLRMARLRKGFRSAAAAARSLGVNPVTYRTHESGQRGLDAEIAKHYAKKFDVTPAWLLLGDNDNSTEETLFAANERLRDEAEKLPAGQERDLKLAEAARFEEQVALRLAAEGMDLGNLKSLPRGVQFVMVRGVVEAGAWREAVEWPEEDWFPFGVAGVERYDAYPKFGLQVRGPSMNMIYPEGSILACVSFLHLGRDPQTGERVIVEHRKGGFVEATVKELAVEADGPKLYARSDNPRYAGAIALPSIDDQEENQDDEVRVTALVIASVRPEIT